MATFQNGNTSRCTPRCRSGDVSARRQRDAPSASTHQPPPCDGYGLVPAEYPSRLTLKACPAPLPREQEQGVGSMASEATWRPSCGRRGPRLHARPTLGLGHFDPDFSVDRATRVSHKVRVVLVERVELVNRFVAEASRRNEGLQWI